MLEPFYILGWPKSLFRFFCKMLQKNTKEILGQLNISGYEYTVEVRNKFKGLDLIECLMNYGWSFMTLYRHKDQGHPQEKEMQKSKMAV